MTLTPALAAVVGVVAAAVELCVLVVAAAALVAELLVLFEPPQPAANKAQAPSTATEPVIGLFIGAPG
jgi:hypothetical protein